MNYEIIKVSSNLYQIINADTGVVVSKYVSMSNAKRGLARLIAKAEKAAANEQVGGSSAPLTGEQCADGRGAERTPPASNTGGQNGAGGMVEAEEISERYEHQVMVNGQLKSIPLRRGVSTAAHIDTLTLVLRQSDFIDDGLKIDDSHLENIHQLAKSISSTLDTLLGYGITEQRNGINGYKYSFRMASESAVYGTVAFGGLNQKDSVMIHLYGDGLIAAKDGWETRLYNWIQAFAPFAKITRCDLAHDFVNGEYTPDQAKQDWIAGRFTQRNTRPRAREHGYDWLDERHPQHSDNGQSTEYIKSGKTLYIGTPQSSRMVRVYEKGCELGDKASPWVRFELQLRNRDYVIPHEIIIAPGEYLTGAYPICETLFTQYQQQISKAERVKKTELINLEHVVYYASQAVSPCINALERLGFDSGEIVTLLKGGKLKLPKRLGADKFDWRAANLPYVHKMQSVLDSGQGIYIRDYLDDINRLEEAAKLKRMQDTYLPHWQDDPVANYF